MTVPHAQSTVVLLTTDWWLSVVNIALRVWDKVPEESTLISGDTLISVKHSVA